LLNQSIKPAPVQDLIKHGHISIIPLFHKTVVVTVTGAIEEVEGTADIILHFEGLNKTKLSFAQNVLIHLTIIKTFY
jgi:hypothetical protein